MSQCVLIVEDNPLNLELARDVLEAHGYEILSARNAEECFAVLAARIPDLILMDIQLPGMDGLAITRALRADPATRDLRIVAMTAHAMTEDAAHVRAAGCDGYLVKPIQTRRLAQQIAGFLSSAGHTANEAPPEWGTPAP